MATLKPPGFTLGRAAMLACAAIISAPPIACAERLFFDCHGTAENTPANENPKYHQKPMDLTAQIMIDESKGVAEYPGAGYGDNRYCSQESDWMPGITPEISLKVIKECTTLTVSSLRFNFDTTFEYGKMFRGEQRPGTKGRSFGRLNRITGELFVEQQIWPIDAAAYPNRPDLMVWKMTCVPAKRKF